MLVCMVFGLVWKLRRLRQTLSFCVVVALLYTVGTVALVFVFGCLFGCMCVNTCTTVNTVSGPPTEVLYDRLLSSSPLRLSSWYP